MKLNTYYIHFEGGALIKVDAGSAGNAFIIAVAQRIQDGLHVVATRMEEFCEDDEVNQWQKPTVNFTYYK